MTHAPGTALALLVAALVPASVRAVPPAVVGAAVVRVATAGHGVRRLPAARRREQRPAPATHRPGSSPGGALEARRDDGRGRSSTFRGSVATSRRDGWRRGRFPLGRAEPRRVALASVFHEAHAPPAPVPAVAGRHS